MALCTAIRSTHETHGSSTHTGPHHLSLSSVIGYFTALGSAASNAKRRKRYGLEAQKRAPHAEAASIRWVLTATRIQRQLFRASKRGQRGPMATTRPLYVTCCLCLPRRGCSKVRFFTGGWEPFSARCLLSLRKRHRSQPTAWLPAGLQRLPSRPCPSLSCAGRALRLRGPRGSCK